MEALFIIEGAVRVVIPDIVNGLAVLSLALCVVTPADAGRVISTFWHEVGEVKSVAQFPRHVARLTSLGVILYSSS